MLPSDMMMSTDIQVAFVAPRVLWYPDSCGARNADQVDNGPLESCQFAARIDLVSPRLARGIDGYQELMEIQGYT
ncbi:unnamed protein product [Prunus armeniaca]